VLQNISSEFVVPTFCVIPDDRQTITSLAEVKMSENAWLSYVHLAFPAAASQSLASATLLW